MAYAYPKTNTVGRAYPNWLSSEVGLTQKTYLLLSAGVSADENGKKIIKSGSVFKVNGTAVGLVFGPDADVTNGDLEYSIMIAGRVFENRLPASIAEGDKSALVARGIHFDTAPEVTRV